MDAKLKIILKNLPAKKFRSRLEPYRELIREMRRRGRSYREIIQVLHDECDLQVSVSTLHDFVRLHSRASRQVTSTHSGANKITKARNKSTGLSRDMEVFASTRRNEKEHEGHSRTYRKPQGTSTTKFGKKALFQYDPDEPLRLSRK